MARNGALGGAAGRWQIENSGGAVVGENSNPQGWNVTFNSSLPEAQLTQVTVFVPAGQAAGSLTVNVLNNEVGGPFGKLKKFTGAFNVISLAVPGAPTGCTATPAHVD